MGYPVVKIIVLNGLPRMILSVLLILVVLNLSRCSLVLDSMSQNTVYVSSYCPSIKNCIEGTHVMCQYYNHRQTVGHLCKNYVKVTITPQMAQQILEGVNKIRMKLATGKETGKDERPLPRAYGMMKMHWDSELATLAQVLADQCLGPREDNCRATEKFSNPSQIITLINFNAPNWEYLTRNTTESGLNIEKIRSSIDKALKSLHAVKKLITRNDVYNCPILETLSDKGSRSYLKLIRGKATHIGCGISAYTRSIISNSGTQHIYNSIQLVCNISDGPLQSQPVYTTDPPIPGTGFTDKCGCPEGYRDSMGCLCERDIHSKIENINIRGQSYSHELEPCDDPDGICDAKPNVVLLPIFDIQDAPNSSYEPENDVERQFHRRFGNTSFIQTSIEENEISGDEGYPDTEIEFLKMHKNDMSNLEFIKTISSEQEEFKSPDNIANSDEGPAKHYNNLYSSMNDKIIHDEPRQISNYDDKMANSDVYRDRTEEESTFLSILDHLELAVKNIKLEGKERDIFDYKMRKIYEAALKSKTPHEPHEHELEDEFQKLTDFLKRKSDAELADESVFNDKDDQMSNYVNRRDDDSGEFNNDIDEKLIQILTHKHHHQENYFSEPSHTDLFNGANDAYDKYPAPRKQKKIIDYNKKLPNNGNRDDKRMLSSITEPNEGNIKKRNRKETNKRRQKQKSDRMRKRNKFNQDIKTAGRRTFSYPEHKLRGIPKYPGYRRLLETANERPTVPTTPNYEKIKVEIHSKKHLKRNRPIM